MGTTLNQINAGGGVRYAWVLAIEGYPNLITNHADTAAVVTAWSGTDWTTCIAGLQVEGTYEQSIEPWQRSLEPNSQTFRIMDADGTDTLGAVLFANAAGNETELTAAADCDDATWTVASTANFASSGTLYCGVETVTYTGKTSTTFTGVVRGKYSPFSRDSGTVTGFIANRFGRDHTFATAGNDAYIQTKVTDAPRLWTGKRVGLWMHRISGTTLDVKAQAHLVFAGQISGEIQETPTGEIVIECDDLKARLKNTTLMHDQFKGRIDEGIYLSETATDPHMQFYAAEQDRSGTPATRVSNALTVVSGASGTNQIEPGVYTAQQILTSISIWLAGELAAARLNGEWDAGIRAVDNVGSRTVISAYSVYSGSWKVRFLMPVHVSNFLGYTAGQALYLGIGFAELERFGYGSSGLEEFMSPNAPRRASVGASIGGVSRINVTGTQGTWIDQRTTLPQTLQQGTSSSFEYGIVRVGETFALAKEITAGAVYDLYWNDQLTAMFGGSFEDISSLSEDDEGDIEFIQVFVYQGNFRDFFLRVLCSTGTGGYNHGTFDEFPAQMGAAIPWEVCGADMSTSLLSLEAEATTQPMFVIDKPVSLETEILAELLLRTAWIVWVEGELKIAQFQNPLAAIAVHSFTEANKGSSISGDEQRVVPTITSEYLVNVVKVEFNRRAFGTEDYADSATFKLSSSISDYGESKPFTIKARHSYVNVGGTNVEAMVANVVGKLMPIFGRPVKVLRGRTIQPEHYEQVAPGDLGTLTDNFVRDPDTGLRGITGKPCLVLAKRHQWDGGDLFGEVDLLIADLDNTALYAPSSGLDPTSYLADTPQAGQSTIDAVTTYSTTGDDEDYFAAGDEVSIIVVDPDDPASVGRWNVTIVSIGSGSYVLDDNLWDDTGGPPPPARPTAIRMVSQSYTSAAATQKTKAYQADDADLQVQDSRSPYEYGRYTSSAGTASTSTELPERHSADMFGDGVPMATAYHSAAAKFVHNFIDYKGAIQCPQLFRTTLTTGGTTGDYLLMIVCPVFFGPGNLAAAGVNRSVSIAPMMRADAAGTVTVRVTFSLLPPTGTSLANVTFQAPYQQVSFTSSSTSYAIATAQDLAQVSNMRHGFGFMSIELLAGSAADPEIIAISEWQQNPRS